jgi:hypothetical protein
MHKCLPQFTISHWRHIRHEDLLLSSFRQKSKQIDHTCFYSNRRYFLWVSPTSWSCHLPYNIQLSHELLAHWHIHHLYSRSQWLRSRSRSPLHCNHHFTQDYRYKNITVLKILYVIFFSTWVICRVFIHISCCCYPIPEAYNIMSKKLNDLELYKLIKIDRYWWRPVYSWVSWYTPLRYYISFGPTILSKPSLVSTSATR